MLHNSKILITGASGLLGKSLIDRINNFNKNNELELLCPSRMEMDCTNYQSVYKYMSIHKPDYIFHLAAKVFGLQGNLDNQFLSLSENTIINDNIFKAISNFPVKKIFYAGTVAEYSFPYRYVPLQEKDLLLGEPHHGEYGYAMAKIHALAYLNILKKYYKVNFTYGLLTNLYGPNDRFNINNGHVIPSLILKAFEANKSHSILKVWGSPYTTRDFLFSYDAADAILLATSMYDGIINISSGIETSMGTLVDTIIENFPNIQGVEWEKSKPVGIPRRVVDSTKLSELGFSPAFDIKEGIKYTIDWFKNHTNVRC